MELVSSNTSAWQTKWPLQQAVEMVGVSLEAFCCRLGGCRRRCLASLPIGERSEMRELSDAFRSIGL